MANRCIRKTVDASLTIWSRKHSLRGLQTLPTTLCRRYQTWQFNKKDREFQCVEAEIPLLKDPSDVLVKVHAASVNPIDVRITEGYGATGIGFLQNITSCSKGEGFTAEENILTNLGRDFSGTVLKTGPAVKDYNVGDQVYGALDFSTEGSHAEIVKSNIKQIAHKPRNISHVEAAAIPYAALTFTSAVHTFSQVTDLKNKRVILDGASGGIGTFAIQYLKCKGAEVTAVCSSQSRDLVNSLNPDNVIEYTSPDFQEQLRQNAGYDLAFSCISTNDVLITLCKPGGVFVTVTNPLLNLLDQNGMIAGTVSASIMFAQKACNAWKDHGVHYRWAYYIPDHMKLEEIENMITAGQIKPVIDTVYEFSDLPSAYGKIAKGNGRGKTVLSISD